jgi:hypothetical protein
VLDVVGGGVRFRLRVPRYGVLRLVAATSALVVAGATAWLAGLVAWHTGDSLPTEAEVTAAVTVAVPDATARMPAGHRTCDRSCLGNPSFDRVTYDDPFQHDATMPALDDRDRPRSTDPATQRVYLPLAAPHEEMPAFAHRAHDLLAADGWRVSPVRTHYDMRSFWATKGDLTLRFEGRGTTQPESPAVAFVVHHDAPAATLPAAAGGAVAGALAGWWLAAFAIRRHLLHGPRVRKAAVVISTPALIMLGINASSMFAGTAVALVQGGSGVAQSLLLGLPAGSGQMLPMVAALGLVAIGLVMTRPAAGGAAGGVLSLEGYGRPGP